MADGARMIFIDTQADSPAVHFWRRQGFGHSQAHVFMSKSIARGGSGADRAEQHPDSARAAAAAERLDPEDVGGTHYYSFHVPADGSAPATDAALLPAAAAAAAPASSRSTRARGAAASSPSTLMGTRTLSAEPKAPRARRRQSQPERL